MRTVSSENLQRRDISVDGTCTWPTAAIVTAHGVVWFSRRLFSKWWCGCVLCLFRRFGRQWHHLQNPPADGSSMFHGTVAQRTIHGVNPPTRPQCTLRFYTNWRAAGRRYTNCPPYEVHYRVNNSPPLHHTLSLSLTKYQRLTAYRFSWNSVRRFLTVGIMDTGCKRYQNESRARKKWVRALCNPLPPQKTTTPSGSIVLYGALSYAKAAPWRPRAFPRRSVLHICLPGCGSQFTETSQQASKQAGRQAPAAQWQQSGVCTAVVLTVTQR